MTLSDTTLPRNPAVWRRWLPRLALMLLGLALPLLLLAGLLRRMKQVAESHDARLVVMIIPSADQVAAGPRAKEPDPEHEPDDEDDAPVPGLENPQGTLAEIADRL